jgi:hypothetical protein
MKIEFPRPKFSSFVVPAPGMGVYNIPQAIPAVLRDAPGVPSLPRSSA